MIVVDKRLAYHEAGHAVIANQLGMTVDEIVMNHDPSYVNISNDGRDKRLELLFFLLAGNAVEDKLDPVGGWQQYSDYDNNEFFNQLDDDVHQDGNEVTLLDAEVYGEYGDADEETREIDDFLRYEKMLCTIRDPVIDLLNKQIASFLDIPEIWNQIEALGSALLTADRLSRDDVITILN